MEADSDELIEAYHLGADEGITDHDETCMAQAEKLLKIGYLEYETAAYAVAYQKDGEIYYYLSDSEVTMHKYLRKCQENGIYPTPVKYFYKRFDLVKNTKEEVRRQFYGEIAQKLKGDYPPLYFEAIEQLTQNALDSKQAFFLLQEMTEQLDSCFDPNQLQLFGNLLDMMLKSRLLGMSDFILLKQWLQKEDEKIAVEPIASGNYKRTYAGFSYESPEGQKGSFFDAFSYMATEKQISLLSQGYMVTPILQIAYYANSFQKLQSCREKYKAALQTYLGERYIKLMHLIRQIPPCVDTAKYDLYCARLKSINASIALNALKYYGNIWNIQGEQ